uniref:Ribosomal protein S7 n=1 Tax=Amorphochlora amoebiformis TaxID=1561963 RepID=A0A0H5BI04_9EUKA|nr:ribosomal protein S7 [Amorphochlora amoebiformis]|mmetsp:Transcript_30016/g.48004  ORF Transcript_30016/g.48004 Transcript_30016/m.48004 type:complete len:190 (-) Transcript_30016:880-1449(-)
MLYGLLMEKITEVNSLKFTKIVLKAIKKVKKKFPYLGKNIIQFKYKYIKEFSCDSSKKRLVIFFIPISVLNSLRKIQLYILYELSKSVKDLYFAFCSIRSFIPRKFQKIRGIVSYNRSFKKINENVIRDIIFPSDITGKRVFFFHECVPKINIYIQDNRSFFSQERLNLMSGALKILLEKIIKFTVIRR